MTDLSDAEELLELGRKYDIKSLSRECHNFLLERKFRSVKALLLAQEYQLNKLLQACIESIGETSSFKELQNHPRYKEIGDAHRAHVLTMMIENNRCKMEEWRKKVISRAESMKSDIPTVPSKYLAKDFKHKHKEYIAGCGECFYIFAHHFNRQLECILSEKDKMPLI